MDQFFSGCIIHDTDKCVGYLSEILSSDICIVDRYGKCDTFDVGWNLCQIDHDLFVIAFAGTGQIVAHMFDTSGRMFQISVKDKFFFGRAFAVGTAHKCCCIQVKICSCIKCVHIPSESYHNAFQSRISFCQIYFLSF